jgi:hypothetical protein
MVLTHLHLLLWFPSRNFKLYGTKFHCACVDFEKTLNKPIITNFASTIVLPCQHDINKNPTHIACSYNPSKFSILHLANYHISKLQISPTSYMPCMQWTLCHTMSFMPFVMWNACKHCMHVLFHIFHVMAPCMHVQFHML